MRNSNIDFISSKMIIMNSNKIYGIPWDWNRFKKTMNVVHPGSLHNRNLFMKFGLYDIDYKIIGDYEFLLRVGENLKSVFIDVPTVIFSTGGISSNSYFKINKEIRKAKLKNKSRTLLLINIEFLIRILINFIIVIKKRIFNIFIII